MAGAPARRVLFSKGAPEGVTISNLTINAHNAILIAGGGHALTVFDEDNNVVPGSERTVDRNTLIYATDDAFYRIESRLPGDDLVRIAGSLP